MVAYASMGCGELLSHPVVMAVARECGKTPAQVRCTTSCGCWACIVCWPCQGMLVCQTIVCCCPSIVCRSNTRIPNNRVPALCLAHDQKSARDDAGAQTTRKTRGLTRPGHRRFSIKSISMLTPEFCMQSTIRCPSLPHTNQTECCKTQTCSSLQHRKGYFWGLIMQCAVGMQVLLRWGLEEGCAVIPKSVNLQHLQQLTPEALLSWQLEAKHKAALDALEDEHKYCWDPKDVA